MSANTGVAPHCQTALAVAMNESEGTITSSPGPTPDAYRARCSAVVQLVVATASGAPTRSAKARSNSCTRGPWVSQPEAITSATASASPPPNHGRGERDLHQPASGAATTAGSGVAPDLVARHQLDEPRQALLEADLGA